MHKLYSCGGECKDTTLYNSQPEIKINDTICLDLMGKISFELYYKDLLSKVTGHVVFFLNSYSLPVHDFYEIQIIRILH